MSLEKAMVADDGKPGKSLKETSTEELKATLAKLKPTDPGAEGRIKAIKGELASRGGGGDMEKGRGKTPVGSLTPSGKSRRTAQGYEPVKEGAPQRQQKKFSGYKDKKYEAAGPEDRRKEGESMDDYIARLKKLYPAGKKMEKAKQPSESTSLTPEKARQMLHERSGGHGRPITEQQRKFFGAVGGHLPAPGGKAKKSMSYENLDDFLEKGGIPWGGMTPKGYKKVKGAGGKAQYIKPGEAKKPAAAAPSGPMTAEAASKLVNESVMKTGDGKSHRFSDDPAKAQKVLDGLPSGTRVTRYDSTGYHDTTMVKQGNKWITENAESAQDDWDIDEDVGYETKHEFNSAEMGKIVSRGWNDAHIFLPKAGSAASPTTAPASFGSSLMQAAKDNPSNSAAHMISRSKPEHAERILENMSMDPRYKDEAMALLDAAEKIHQGGMAKSMGNVMSLEDWMEKGGPYIGERGGRWEDPQHTIPWKGEKKPSGGKAKKLNAKQANALRAAAKFGVVPGGAHATFSMVNKLADAGLLESSKENPQVYRPTEAGKQALASGSYKPATKTKGGEAPSGEGGEKKPPSGGTTEGQAAYREARNLFRTADEPGKRYREGMSEADMKKVEALIPKIDNDMAKKQIVDALKSAKERAAKIRGGGEGVTIKPGMEGKTVKPASMAGPGGPEGVKVKPGMEGKTVKPAGEAPKAGGGGLPEPKISKIGNATIRTYGDVGIIRSQPKLGHTVLDAEGTEIGDIGRHKSLAAAEKYLMRMKKSMGEVMSLDEYLEKSGGLPTHEQGLGHAKSSSVEGGSADGGELADVGRTSGSSDSAPGPEQDGQGQLKGVSPGGKQKLSEDDAEEEKQMTEHKKPIETIKKSRFPADQRDSVAHEQAAVVSRLQKSEDVYVGPDRHPFSHYATHASGDLEASEMVKSEGFYHGKSPQFAPSRPIIEQGVLCKAVNASGCDESYSAALTSCPSCGAGTVGHRHLPGGSVMGAETAILEKSVGPGSLLRRPTQEPDVKIG